MMQFGGFKLDRSGTYYLSGPMSNIPEYNVPAFKNATHELRSEGIEIVSPHELEVPGHIEDEQELWQHMMNMCFEVIPKCDGIILLKGWPVSRGARQELEWFLDNKRPVYYYNNFQLLDMNLWGL